MRRILAALSLITTVAFAVDQEQQTPYDLIRPVWPLVWDTSDAADGGTVMSYSQFEALVTTKGAVPDVGTMPQDFEPNENVPDSTSQFYLDARNMKIGHIRVNQAGYLPNSTDPYQHFYYIDESGSCDVKFSVTNAAGTEEYVTDGEFTSTSKTTKSDWTIIASYNAATDAAKERYKVSATGPEGTVCEGFLGSYSLPEDERLRIKVGNEYSATFIVSEDVYSMVRDAVFKFYGINRSGDSESWFHDPSHTLDGSGSFTVGTAATAVSGFTASAGDFSGGWYDCGDHLKESQTMAYAFIVAAVMSAANPDRDEDHYAYNHAETVNTDGIPDILREAKHGADFFLKSFRHANGIVDNMVVSVGNFGSDHGWWGRPEAQDGIPESVTGRGGPHERDLRLGELGSNISSEIAAGLAILSVTYAEYDQDFADSCLIAAKALYDFAKNLMLGTGSYGDGQYSYVYNTVPAGWSSSAYNGNNEAYDDLGLAAIALHYATYDPDNPDMTYLNDAVEDTEIGVEQESTVGFWNGGWFAYTRDGMRKSSKNTSWANAYTFTLYAFYKLLLIDDETAASFGIDSDTRLSYAEKVALMLATNIYSLLGNGGGSISLPGLSGTNTLTFNELWYNMTTDQTWIYNRYQAGNIFEVLAYADVTKDLEGVKLPSKGVSEWHSSEMKQLGINQLNYMLGVNPWDVSFLLGVGDKNDAHPHHRGANPEGKNMPGNAYTYSPPVGALFGGVAPDDENSWSPSNHSWEDYLLSETCIDGTAIFLSAAAMATKSVDLNAAPSEITVEIQYVGYDSAIVHITQDMRGQAMILYSTSENGPFSSIAKDSVASVDHQIILRGLTNGTTYYFKVVAINSRSENYTTKWLVDSTYTPYYFTTLASEAPSADIQNVKVCNVTADSAEIMWYTPNGQYESKVYWDTVLTTYDQMQWNTGDTNADVSGIPVSFHYVKIGGLQEKTTYYFVVESNGSRRSVDDDGSPLKFTTPVMQYDFEVRTYQYEFTGLDFVNLNVYNNEERSFDSLTLRLYVTALPEEVDECALMMDSDICQAYDAAGFNNPCEYDTEIRSNLRGAMPVRLDDTYDAATGKYDYYFPIDLGPTTIQSSSRLRIDVGFSLGLYQNNACDPLRSTPAKRMDSTTGDWTWAKHTREEDGADYDGMWIEDKDWGDTYQAPVNSFVVVYRKDQFVWGYSPSYSEMTTKVAKYELTVSFDEPFDVTSGSYVEIDSTTSTMYVTGVGSVSESGYITAIWVNGTALSASELALAAIYDSETGRYIFNIPVKLTIGTNKVDITIFAGPDPECSECQENGGCAFVNRNYYINYSKGDRTASTLTLVHSDETSVSSPAATDGSEQFYIVVRDKDNKSNKTVYAYIVNSRTGDSLQVELTRTDSASGTFKSELITAKSTASASYPTISFYGGDTITVVYIDAEDEEDISSQSFYANPTHPVPVEAIVTADCSTKPEEITVTFSGSSFDKDITLDSASFTFDSTSTNSSAVTIVMKPTSVDGTTATFTLDSSLVPTTGAPSGTAVFYMTEDGVVTTESISLTDGMAPYLISVTILENEDHANEQDTLKIAFSEPVVLASKTAWPLRITDGTNEISTDGLTVVSVSSSDNGKSWQYVITGNDDGAVIKEGYLAEVYSTFSVSDVSMNSLSDCGVVTIAESVRPVPVDLARISDKTGDGQPDEIYLEFESVLREKDMLDSFDVYWGVPATYHSFVMPSSGWDVDTVVGDLKLTPVVSKTDSACEDQITKYSNTTSVSVYCVLKEYACDTLENDSIGCDSNTVLAADSTDSLYVCGSKDSVTGYYYDTLEVCTYTLDTTGYDTTQSSYTVMRIEVPEGVYTGLTYGANNGRGTVMPRKGEEGGFFDQSYTLNDDCPPIVSSATWSSRDLSSGQLDLLEVTYSEPLDSVEGNSYYLERRRSGVSGTYLTTSNIYGSPMNGTSLKTVTYMYYDESDNAVWIGDSVRMISDEAKGYYKDEATLFPGEETPWVAVSGVVEKVKFKVKMLSSVTKRDKDVTPYGGQTIGDDEHWRLTIPTDNGELLIASGKKKLDDVKKSSVISGYEHAGPVFKIEVTMPEVLDKTDLGEYKRSYSIGLELKLYNNLGTYVNEMKYTFNLDDYLSYVSANSVLTLYLEWVAPEDAPYTLDSRQVGSGAFIGNFEFKAAAPYVAKVADEGDTKTAVKGKSSKTITFGVRR